MQLQLLIDTPLRGGDAQRVLGLAQGRSGVLIFDLWLDKAVERSNVVRSAVWSARGAQICHVSHLARALLCVFFGVISK